MAVRYLAPALLGLALAGAAAAQGLSIARGMGGRTLEAPLNQAVVIESAESFAEVSIAEPGIADVQPLSDRTFYLFGRGVGRTTLTLLNAEGRLLSSATVIVQPDLGELKERLSTLLPGEPIEVRTTGAGVVLSGLVSGAQEVERALSLARSYSGEQVVNLLSVGGANQVSLRVRIAEVNRTAAKELGVGLGVGRAGDPEIGIGTGGVRPIIGGGVVDFIRPQPPGFLALDAIFSVGESLLLDVSIDALERKGFARTLAEPNLVALSGGEADFLAGGEVPIPAITADGEIEITFRPVGVKLGFVPVVITGGRMSVTVAAEVASVDPALGISTFGVDVPGFTVRRTSTVVELADGQSFAIAGLYQDDFSDAVRQVPWLGELPVLGALFRSAEFQRGETELVVIVTARLVAPVADADMLATPATGGPPSEADLFLLGEVEDLDPEAARLTADGFDGPYGYVLD